MKINPILAFVACLFGLLGVFFTYSSSAFTSDLLIGIMLTALSSVLALAGIFLFNKDFKIAIVQYFICAAGSVLGIGLYAIPAFVLLVAAAAVCFFEKEKSENYTEKNVLDAHFFGDESEIRERYSNFPKNTTNSTVYWIIPVVTIILLLLVGVVGDLAYESDMNSRLDSIEITDLTSDIRRNNTNYTGGVHANLTSQRDFSNVQVKGKWYSDNGTIIEETYDNNVTNIKKDQKYQIYLQYNKPTTIKPKKVEIEVYEPEENMVLCSKNVTFN